MCDTTGMDARQALHFLESSDLVNLDMPLRQVVHAAGQIDELRGYVLAWEKWVLVVPSADCPQG